MLPLFKSATYTFQPSTKKEKTQRNFIDFSSTPSFTKIFRSHRHSRVNPFIQRPKDFFRVPTSWTLFYVHRGNFFRFPAGTTTGREKPRFLLPLFAFVHHHHPSNSHSNNQPTGSSFHFPWLQNPGKKNLLARGERVCQEEEKSWTKNWPLAYRLAVNKRNRFFFFSTFRCICGRKNLTEGKSLY